MEYAARYVFVEPSSADILENRLNAQNTPSETVEDILKRLPDQLQTVAAGGFYDTVIIGDDLEEAYESLRGFIYGTLANGTATNGEKAPEDIGGDKDEPMPDASANADPVIIETNGVEA
jgi:THO complex subunit 1